MRIGLLNEGTYPVTTGGVSTWCDQLITLLDEHTFDVVTLVGQDRTSKWRMPTNVTSCTLAPMWDPVPPSRPRGRKARGRRRRVRTALMNLWASVLPGESGVDLDLLRRALVTLSVSGTEPLSVLLDHHSSAKAILAAWPRHAEAHNLQGMSAAMASEVARHSDRTLAVLDIAWPRVDVINASSNGPAALIAMARHWRDGTPIVLTEHGVYLRERYLALGAAGWPWAVRYALMAFTRAICQLAYREAAWITPVSEFNGRWEQQLGASSDRIRPIPNGVDPTQFPVLNTEPDEPVVSFVGRIDPLKDLITLVEALSITRKRVPGARLRLFGPTPSGNEAYLALVKDRAHALGLADCVTFEGPAPSARPAIEAGQVVALSSISEGLPFTVIETMMSGRASVSTDVGGVAECTGRDGQCGIVVPPRDPFALGEALADLLLDRERRLRMGEQARERALSTFSLALFADRYRGVYEDAYHANWLTVAAS